MPSFGNTLKLDVIEGFVCFLQLTGSTRPLYPQKNAQKALEIFGYFLRPFLYFVRVSFRNSYSTFPSILSTELPPRIIQLIQVPRKTPLQLLYINPHTLQLALQNTTPIHDFESSRLSKRS